MLFCDEMHPREFDRLNLTLLADRGGGYLRRRTGCRLEIRLHLSL